ncbi:hypothetical protein BaRGS_00020779 [Batillaria attramentaria]|uniref:Uncharacterized protein n=1 Tax=Batillaria attramentaria TaxID=370345 RepID=A0ABD0KLN2_9CAEN
MWSCARHLVKPGNYKLIDRHFLVHWHHRVSVKLDMSGSVPSANGFHYANKSSDSAIKGPYSGLWEQISREDVSEDVVSLGSVILLILRKMVRAKH